ncbi:hypothetical protein BDR26DRAFT_888632 [Obelidium mucronatum]|nr:hypothetical protein BDR26DRAFT_888632 [Obelidium mucronatum]
MNNIKAIQKLNERELDRDLTERGSWHNDYAHSAYIYVGGLAPHLSEGDIVVVFSQVGEVVDLNLPRDGATGKARGFCFLAFEDQRSTVLAVDNFNGAPLAGRTLRVDHVADYKAQKVKAGESEAEREERVCAERLMRLRVLPPHLMDADERLEAEREGILVAKGLGVGDRTRDGEMRRAGDEAPEEGLEDPMHAYILASKKSKKEKKDKKKKHKKEKKEKKEKKSSNRDKEEDKEGDRRRQSPSPSSASSNSSRSPSPLPVRKDETREKDADSRSYKRHGDSETRSERESKYGSRNEDDRRGRDDADTYRRDRDSIETERRRFDDNGNRRNRDEGYHRRERSRDNQRISGRDERDYERDNFRRDRQYDDIRRDYDNRR